MEQKFYNYITTLMPYEFAHKFIKEKEAEGWECVWGVEIGPVETLEFSFCLRREVSNEQA